MSILQDMVDLIQSAGNDPARMYQYNDCAARLLAEYGNFVPAELFTLDKCTQEYLRATGDTVDIHSILLLRSLHYFLIESFVASQKVNIQQPLHPDNARFISTVKCTVIIKKRIDELEIM